MLVAIMIAIPVALATVAGLLVASTQPTLQERVTVQLGHMQARLLQLAGPGSAIVQNPLDENDATGTQSSGRPLPVASVVPAHTTVLPVGTAAATVRTRAGVGSFPAIVGEAWDSRFRGRYNLLTGRAPTRLNEIAVTATALSRLRIRVGSSVDLVRPAARTVTVVGVLDDRTVPASMPELFGTRAAFGLSTGAVENLRYYLPDDALDWADVQALNRDGYTVFSRQVALDPPTLNDPGLSNADAATSEQAAVLAALISLFLAVVVVLLSGAAHAVTIRTQQHDLAVLATVGAAPRLLSRIARITALLAAIMGALGGVIAGLLVGTVMIVASSDGSAVQYYGWHFPSVAIALAVVIALVSAWVAARRAARAAALTDPLRATREAELPPAAPARTVNLGIAVLLLGALVTGIGAAGVAGGALQGDGTLSFLVSFAVVPVLVGPLLLLSGSLAVLPLLLAALDRIGRVTPIWTRIALRDLHRNRQRGTPAIAAIMVTTFFAVAVMTLMNGYSAAAAAHYAWTANRGQVVVPLHFARDASDYAETATMRPEQAVAAVHQAFPRASVQVLSAVRDDVTDFSKRELNDSTRLYPTLPFRADCGACHGGSNYFTSTDSDSAHIYVGDAAAVSAVLGAPIAPTARQTLDHGGAISLWAQYIQHGHSRIEWWTAEQLAEGVQFEPGAHPARTDRLSAVLQRPVHPLHYGIVVSHPTAARLGLAVTPFSMIVTPRVAPTPAQLDRLRLALGTLQNDPAGGAISYEAGPADSNSTATWIAVSLAVLLVVAASFTITSLIREEARPTTRILTAAGLGPRAARLQAGTQAGITAFTGTIIGSAISLTAALTLGLPAGPLPFAPDWPAIVMLALVLPVAIAVAAGVSAPRAEERPRGGRSRPGVRATDHRRRGSLPAAQS